MKNEKNANRLFFIWNIINLMLASEREREKKACILHEILISANDLSSATTSGFWCFYRSRTIEPAIKINNADSLKKAIK